MANIQDLYNKRANVFSHLEELKARGFTAAEDRQAYDQAEAELDDLTEQIAAAETDAKADKVLAGYKADRDRTVDPDDPDARYARAFNSFLVHGLADMDADEKKLVMAGFKSDPAVMAAAGAGTPSAGGYMVPQGFRDILIETLKLYGPMLEESENIETDSGAALPWPTNDDTANVGAILAENNQVTEQDLVFGQAQLDAFMYTSKLVRVSLQLLQDGAFDLETWLPKKLGQRLGRIFNAHFTTGNGTTQPNGIITAATVGVTGTGSFGSTGGIAYTNLVDIQESLDPAYGASSNLKWMGHQSVRKAIRKLKDLQDRPLWEPSVQSGTPDTLLGRPFLVNNDMATFAASSKSLGFGDIRQAYVTRTVREITTLRLAERYADYLQVGFLAFQRADGELQDANAFKVFATTATA